jgi:uncharacterized protein with GYD domain
MSNYLTLIRVSGTSGRLGQLTKSLQNIPKAPSQAVKVIGTWTTFGQYDASILFQANDESQAMDFVDKQIRGIEGVLSTETLVVTPQADYTPGASGTPPK